MLLRFIHHAELVIETLYSKTLYQLFIFLIFLLIFNKAL
jgi:hypothetical protein